MGMINVNELCGLVEKTLCEVSYKDSLAASVHGQSRMGDPVEWDSLSFITVLMAVSEAYGVDLADDDAFHFTSIPSMQTFLEEVTAG